VPLVWSSFELPLTRLLRRDGCVYARRQISLSAASNSSPMLHGSRCLYEFRAESESHFNKTTLFCVITALSCNKYKSVFSRVPWLSTRHCSHLLLSAVLRPRASAARLPAKLLRRYFNGTHRQTGGRTDAVPLHRPCFAYYAAIANNRTYTALNVQKIWNWEMVKNSESSSPV